VNVQVSFSLNNIMPGGGESKGEMERLRWIPASAGMTVCEGMTAYARDDGQKMGIDKGG